MPVSAVAGSMPRAEVALACGSSSISSTGYFSGKLSGYTQDSGDFVPVGTTRPARPGRASPTGR